MERVFPFLADTNGPYKQLLAAEQTAQTVQAWIQEKKDAIRAIKKQAVDQYLPYDATYGQIKLLEDEIGAFKRLLESNEASRSKWRVVHMAAGRATIRPLKVVDMPNEILTRIFANFEDVPAPQIQVDSSPFDDPLPSPDLASIKNIRLTCRTFCEVGSMFILPVVDILFTQSSLQRLEDISNHPIISKSVHTVRVNPNPYIPVLCEDIYDFRDQLYYEVVNLHASFENDAIRTQQEVATYALWDGVILQPQPHRNIGPDFHVALSVSDRLIAAMEKIQESDSESSLTPYDDHIITAIEDAHEEYGRRCRQQRSLVADPHVLMNIATAVRQMPRVQRLCIPDPGTQHWDNIFRNGWDKRYDAQEYASAMTATNPFWDLMVHGGYRGESLFRRDQDPLLPMLHKLPSVLQAANRNLTQLDITLPPLETCHMELLGEHLMNLRHCFQNLKSIQVRILGRSLVLDPQASLAMSYSLLETMLASPRLEVVKLDYLERGKKHGVFLPSVSIGSVFANLPWTNLRSLCLRNLSVKVKELQQILQNVPGKINFELRRINLIDGTWAEALDVLRGKADSSSRVLVPLGGEMKNMSKREIRHFRRKFNSERLDGWYSKLRCPGPVCTYIRGGDIPNPLIWGDD